MYAIKIWKKSSCILSYVYGIFYNCKIAVILFIMEETELFFFYDKEKVTK